MAITNPGGSTPDAVSAAVSVASRYISNAAADRPISFTGGTARWTWATDYTIVFQVAPTNPIATYNVVVNSSILGELTLLDDVGAGAGTVSVTDVTGRLGGVVTPGLGIGGIAQTFTNATALNDAQERNIAGSNSINLGTFAGTQSFTLRFTFTTSAQSPQNGLGGDEASARFGANGPLGSATGDDYPGPGDVVDRNQANDGHFVNVTATLLTVPEPGTVMLLGTGLVGLAVSGTRKRS